MPTDKTVGAEDAGLDAAGWLKDILAAHGEFLDSYTKILADKDVLHVEAGEESSAIRRESEVEATARAWAMEAECALRAIFPGTSRETDTGTKERHTGIKIVRRRAEPHPLVREWMLVIGNPPRDEFYRDIVVRSGLVGVVQAAARLVEGGRVAGVDYGLLRPVKP